MPNSLELKYEYKYSWEVIIEAYFSKYREVPNTIVPDVLGIKYTNMDYEESTDTVTFHRNTQLRLNLPDFLKKIAGVEAMEFGTDVTISRAQKLMLCVTKNITFWPSIQLVEHTRHEPDPSNSDWTVFTTSSTLTLMNLWGLQGPIETAILESAKKGQKIARENEKPYIHEISERGQLQPTEIEEACKNEARLKRQQPAHPPVRNTFLFAGFRPQLDTADCSALYEQAFLPQTNGSSSLWNWLGRLGSWFFPFPDYNEIAYEAAVEVLESPNQPTDFCWWGKAKNLRYPCLVVQMSNFEKTLIEGSSASADGLNFALQKKAYKWQRGPNYEEAKKKVVRALVTTPAAEASKLCVVLIEWCNMVDFTLFRGTLEALEAHGPQVTACFIYPANESFLRCWKLVSPDFSNELCEKCLLIKQKTVYNLSDSFLRRSENRQSSSSGDLCLQAQPTGGLPVCMG